jgi:flagellar hook-associated protein 3 FlgL
MRCAAWNAALEIAMAITTGNLSRVSNSLRVFTALAHIQQNSLKLFREEQRIASGRQLLSVSDDPIAAEKITRLNQSLEGQEQILANLRHADDELAAADSALTEISDLFIDAARIASEQAGSLHSADERAAQAVVIEGIIDQLMNVGNRQLKGLYLFGGREVNQAPMNADLGRITNVGDLGDRKTLVDTGYALAYNATVAEVFDLRQSVTGGYANFNVQLATGVRLSEMDGALGAGIRLGRISVTEGATTFEVDLTGVETVGDLINKFNDAASATTLTIAINPADGATLRLTSGGGLAIQVSEVNNGTTAADLGIKKSVGAGLTLDGDGLNRRVTLTTLLSDLTPGGVVLPNGVVITNGSLSATVTFAGATTVQDVLNQFNGAGVGVRASINDNADGFIVDNLMAGTPLVVGENGGTDAETLGIRTLDSSVSLSRLNGYRGIHPIDGQNDIKVTDAGGVSFEVDLSTAQTVDDVINAIQAAAALAGAAITVQTSLGGAGFRLTGAGAGMISVERVGLSPVATELGIEKTGTVAGVLEGDNVGQFYQTGAFSALYRLRDALLADDSSEITEAGTQINAQQTYMASEAGRIGARSRSMRARMEQTEDAVAATTVLLSGLRDVDFAEAVTKFQQAQTALQASLLTISQTLNLSLMDFLQ